jgi:hypothetical protein
MVIHRGAAAASAAIVAWIAYVGFHTIATGDVIQKWRTPGGGLYFGDRPPPGSTKIGQEGSKSAPESDSSLSTVTSPPRSESDDALSVEASRQRTAIERALNQDAARLEEVKKQITEAERQPDTFSRRVTNYASGVPVKQDVLRSLHEDEQKVLSDIASQWKKFDELNQRVIASHGGNAPDWWRSRITCAACPSRAEAESALQ